MGSVLGTETDFPESFPARTTVLKNDSKLKLHDIFQENKINWKNETYLGFSYSSPASEQNILKGFVFIE